MRINSGHVPDAPGEELLGGWQTIRHSRALTAMLVLMLASSFVTPPLISVLLPGHFTQLGRPEQLGLCISAFAIGTLAGSVLYPALAKGSRRSAFVVGILAMTIGMGLFATLSGFWLIASGALVMGAGSGLFGPVWNVYVAEQVPARVRGQVLGVVNAVGLAAGPLGLGAVSLVLMRWELAVGAAVMAVVWTATAVYALVSPGMRELSTEPSKANEQDAPPIPVS
jgi:MFS family permease